MMMMLYFCLSHTAMYFIQCQWSTEYQYQYLAVAERVQWWHEEPIRTWQHVVNHRHPARVHTCCVHNVSTPSLHIQQSTVRFNQQEAKLSLGYLCARSAFPIQRCAPNLKSLAQVVLETLAPRRNGWHDLERPLNKDQGHSFWYQSICHIRLPIGCQ